MDGFKTLPKMQCFKEGGSVAVKNIMKKGGIAKKGVPAVKEKDEGPKRQMVAGLKGTTPDVEDETTTTMKKGGRAKKDCGTVRKYKAGGAVGVYGAKKKSGDYDSIEKAKKIKPAKADAPSKAAVKPAMKGSDVAKEKSKPAGTSKAKKVSDNAKMADAKSGAKGGPNKYKTGGKVKKMADGGMLSDAAISAGSKGVGPKGNLNDLVYRPTNPAEMQQLREKFAIQNPPADNREYAKPTVARKKGGEVKKMAAGSQTAPLATGPNSISESHKLALLQEMRKLPPAMQLQLLRQQQQIGGTGDMNSIANQMSNPMGQQPQPQMPSGVNPYQD